MPSEFTSNSSNTERTIAQSASQPPKGSWQSLIASFRWIGLPGLALLFAASWLSYQDWLNRDILHIQFDTVPKALQDRGFDENYAAQTLQDDIQQIQLQAEAAMNDQHPALVQADSPDAALQTMTIPDTDIPLNELQDFIFTIAPFLKPHVVTAAFGEPNGKITLDIWLNGKHFSIPPKTTNNDLTTAQSMLFQAGTDNDAAFQIVQNIDPITAMSALNSWGDNGEVSQKLANFMLDPHNQGPRTDNLLGFIQIEQGNYDAAIADLVHAGGFAPAHANLCYIYQDTSYKGYNLNTAEAQCRRAEKLDPSLESPYLHLGVFYKFHADTNASPRFREQQLELARKQFENALALNPDSVSAHSGLGDVFGDPGYSGYDFGCSISQYQAALYPKRAYSIALLGLANSYTGQGDWSGAAKVYNEALKKDPSLNGISNFVSAVEISKKQPVNEENLKSILAEDMSKLKQQSAENLSLESKVFTEMEILSLPAGSPKSTGNCSAEGSTQNPA